MLQLPAARLLIVDDNLMNRDVMSRQLQRSGFEIMSVASGQEALNLIEEGGYSLILLDVNMPGMDGFEVLRWIRRDHSPSSLPVIMVTARDQTQDMVGAFQQGANDYVVKPIDFPVLVARIQAQLSAPARRQQAADRPRTESPMRDSAPPRQTTPPRRSAPPRRSVPPRQSAFPPPPIQHDDPTWSRIVAPDSTSDEAGSFMVLHLTDSSAGSRPVVMTSEVFSPGEHLGNYTIIDVLGRGAMGVVYEAENSLLDRRVALKTLSPGFSSDPFRMKLIQAEARLAARVEHPNVVGVYEMGNASGIHYISMQLIRGQSLQDILESQGPLPCRETSRIMAQACRGLGAVHDCKLIHRDIKPSNIMISKDGVVKLTDFGLAQARTTAQDSNGDEMTPKSPTEVVGTPHFMSPEQCCGQTLTVESDIYAMGATYFKMLTGYYPYHGVADVSAVLKMHLQGAIPDPREIDRGIPETCWKIISRAMAKRPSERYANSGELVKDLESAAGKS